MEIVLTAQEIQAILSDLFLYIMLIMACCFGFKLYTKPKTVTYIHVVKSEEEAQQILNTYK